MQVESRERTGYGYVSTGRLPSPEMVKSLVSEAYERFKSNAEGSSSDVYEALARAPSDLFGVCVVGTSGNVYAVGDTDHPFSIMSVSKPFVFALVCQSIGGEQAREKLGANSTGLPLNSLTAIERSVDGRTNPMVNGGGHRDNKSRAGQERRGQVEIYSRRPVPLCRAKAATERGGLCLRLGDELSQPEHRAPAAELWPHLF